MLLLNWMIAGALHLRGPPGLDPKPLAQYLYIGPLYNSEKIKLQSIQV